MNAYAYTNGRSVVIRDLAEPSRAVIFTEYKAKVNVANFCPNGEWVASGDSEGNVMIWGTDNMIVKNTFPWARQSRTSAGTLRASASWLSVTVQKPRPKCSRGTLATRSERSSSTPRSFSAARTGSSARSAS